MDISEMAGKLKNNTPCRIVKIGYENVVFYFIENRTVQKTVTLKIGIDGIVSDYFIHNVPTEAEVEYAINTIEDELMLYGELINSSEELYSSSRLTAGLLDQFTSGTDVVSRQTVEEIFTRYALVSMGRSPVYDDVHMNRDTYACLLILREIMHHLDFESICFLNKES